MRGWPPLCWRRSIRSIEAWNRAIDAETRASSSPARGPHGGFAPDGRRLGWVAEARDGLKGGVEVFAAARVEAGEEVVGGGDPAPHDQIPKGLEVVRILPRRLEPCAGQLEELAS